jgi:hypothetical protein
MLQQPMIEKLQALKLHGMIEGLEHAALIFGKPKGTRLNGISNSSWRFLSVNGLFSL